MHFSIQVGPIPVQVASAELPPVLEEFFRGFPATHEPPRLRLEFTAGSSGRNRFAEDGKNGLMQALEITDFAAPIAYRLEHPPDSPLIAKIALGEISGIKSRRAQLKLNRFLNSFYLDRDAQSISFIFALWLYLLHILMLEKGGAFIHASCAEREGRALLLPAHGGVGKTATLYRLILQSGFRFLADDMTILQCDGSVFKNPAPPAVYPYNLEGLPRLREQILQQGTLLDRLHWHFWRTVRGSDRVGRRIMPHKIFGSGRISDRATVARVVYLARSDISDFRLERTSVSTVADWATNIMLLEIRQFRFELQKWNSTPGFSLFPNLWEIAEATRRVYLDAFKSAEVSSLLIPKRASADDLYDFLSANVLADRWTT